MSIAAGCNTVIVCWSKIIGLSNSGCEPAKASACSRAPAARSEGYESMHQIQGQAKWVVSIRLSATSISSQGYSSITSLSIDKNMK
jgi:hypothetical protein